MGLCTCLFVSALAIALLWQLPLEGFRVSLLLVHRTAWGPAQVTRMRAASSPCRPRTSGGSI